MAQRGLELVVQEDPPATELVTGKQAATGVLEHGGEREAQEFCDFARGGYILASEAGPLRCRARRHRGAKWHSQMSKVPCK
jgi:hypothetical protein